MHKTVKLYILLLISLVFVSPAICASNYFAPSNRGPQQPEMIIQHLKEAGVLSESATIDEIFDPQSNVASQIIFLNFANHCPRVIKRFKYEFDFEEEMKELEKVKVEVEPELKKLTDTCAWKFNFPKFTTGNAIPSITEGVVVLERAPGKTLRAGYINEINTIDDAKIKDAFYSIGQQFGNLDQQFYKLKQQVLVHRDSHSGNFLYEELTRQLYWIDTSDMYFIDQPSGIESLFFLYEELLKSPARQKQISEFLMKARTFLKSPDLKDLHYLADKERNQLLDELNEIVGARKKELLAVRSFGEGYASMYPAEKDSYNRLIKSIKEAEEINENINIIEQSLGKSKTNFLNLEIL